MSLRINHNISSLNAHRNIQRNDGMLSKSLERLSSGLRINRAADDAAGLIISEQMRAQITGLDQAIDNAETAVNMVQTAEGALDEMNSLLNKARELALHAANEGANDANQLAADQAELDEIINSITRIADNTQFGTKKLLDGTLALQTDIDAGSGITSLNARGLIEDTFNTSLSVAGTEGSAAATANDNGALAATFGSDVSSFTFGASSALKADDYDLTVTAAGSAGVATAEISEAAQAQGSTTGQLAGGTAISALTDDDYNNGTLSMANQSVVDAGSTSAQMNTSMDAAVGTHTSATNTSDLALTSTVTSGSTLTLTAADAGTGASFAVDYTHDGSNWTINITDDTGYFTAGGATGLANGAAYGAEDIDALVADFSAKLAAASFDTTGGGGGSAAAFTADATGGAGAVAFSLTATDHGSYSNDFALSVDLAGTTMTTTSVDGATSGANLTSAAFDDGADASFELQDSSGATIETFTTTVASTRGGSQTAFTGSNGNTITLAGNLTAGAGTVTLSSNDMRDAVDVGDATTIANSDVFSQAVTLAVEDGSGDVVTLDVAANTTISQAISTFNNLLNNDTNDVGVTIALDDTGNADFSITANETGTYANDYSFRIDRDSDDQTLFSTDSVDGTANRETNSANESETAGVGTTVSLTGVGDSVNNTVALTAVNNRGAQNFEAGAGATAVSLSLASDAANTAGGSLLSIDVSDIRSVVRVDNANLVDNNSTLTADVTLSVGDTSVTTTANGGNTIGTALTALNAQLATDGVGASVALDDATGTFTLTALDRGTYSDDLDFSVLSSSGSTLFSTSEIDGGGTAVSATGATNTQGIDATVRLTGQDTGNTFDLTVDRYDETSSGAATFTDEANGTSVTFGDGSNVSHTGAFSTDAEEFQIGANRDQTIDVSIFSMRASDIGAVSDDILTNDALNSLADLAGSALTDGYAQDAISIIDAAIDDVTTTRGDLGAIQSNALETTISSLRVTRENLTAAESTIRDIDFAAESAEFTKNNILIQSSTAMMAQANQLPNVMLQLIG